MGALLTGPVSSYAMAEEAVPEESAASSELLDEITEQTLQIVAQAEDEIAQDVPFFEDSNVPVAAASSGDAFPEEDPAAEDWAEEIAEEGEEELLFLEGGDLIVDDSADFGEEDLPEAGEIPAVDDADGDLPEAAEVSSADPVNADAAEGEAVPDTLEEGTEDLPFEEPETEELYALEEIELETEDDALLMLEETAEDAADALEVSDKDFSFVYRDEYEEEAAITGYYGTDENVNIPSYLHVEEDGGEIQVKVTEIREWYTPNVDVTYIYVPCTVERIGDHAFLDCESLETIVFEKSPATAVEGLMEIGRDAFNGAAGLASITIPATVGTIEEGAFTFSGLKSLTFEEGSEADIGEWAFSRTPLESISFPQDGQIRIGREAFMHCRSLEDLTITGVSYLRNGAFCDCALKSVQINCDLKTIGGRAFSRNSDLVCASIKSVTEIQYGAFSGCVKLDQIDFPRKFIRMGIDAVARTKWLSDQAEGPVNVPGLVGCLYLYKGNAPADYEIPEGYTWINSGAFAGQRNLTSVKIPATVTGIGFEAFLGCSSLEEVEIPATVTTIEPYAFGFTYSDYTGTSVYDRDDYCNYITRSEEFVIKGYAKTAAEEYAEKFGITFVDLSKDETESPFLFVIDNAGKATIIGYVGTDSAVKVPGKVTDDAGEHEVIAIDANAFKEEVGISSVELPASVKTIGESAFAFSRIRTLTIKNASLVIADNAFMASEIAKINFPAGGSVKIGRSAFSGCSGLKKLNLEGVSQIGAYAFDGCENLQEVTAGSKMKQIAQEAFRFDKNLYKVDLKSVTTIEYAAFSWCSRLTNVIFPAKMEKIDYDAFVGTYWLNRKADGPVVQSGVLYTYNGKTPKYLTIPSGVTYITPQAVRYKQELEAIELPTTLKEVGSEAFIDCLNLRSVHIPSSVGKIGACAFGYKLVGPNEGGTKYLFEGRTSHYVKKAPSLTIYGIPGTAAQNYAKANGFTFYPLDDNNMPPAIILNVSGRLPMKVGQVFSGVTATCTFPKDKIDKWSSNNPRIVGVDALSGKLTAKRVGIATITVKSKLGGKASFVVTVGKKKIRTKGITVSSVKKKTVTLKKKKSQTLKALLNPLTSQEKITFKTSNKKVVTVTKKGKIKALKKGKAKITIKSGKKKITITVKVK